MSSLPQESVAAWIAGLKSGQQNAAEAVWKRFFSRLVRFAEKQLGSHQLTVADGEDVALSAICCLCRGAQDGRFDAVITESGLWRLLVRITYQKSIDVRRREQAGRRGGDAEVREADLLHGSTPLSLDDFAGTEPTPESVALLEEQFTRLLSLLPNQVPQVIVIMKMQGCKSEEIAKHLGISVHSVRRKIRLAEQKWKETEIADLQSG